MSEITAQQYFDNWCNAAKRKETFLLRNWDDPGKLTDIILNSESPLIADVATSLDLLVFCEYYKIDAVLYRNEDKVPLPTSEVTLRKIRVAFEHENNFQSGLFREAAHLLITNCELKVLVSYPKWPDEINKQLEYLHGIISGIDDAASLSESESFLFVMGWGLDKISAIAWYGFVYEKKGWKLLLPPDWAAIETINGIIEPSEFLLRY